MNKEELISELDSLGFVPYKDLKTSPIMSYVVSTRSDQWYDVYFVFVGVQFRLFYKQGKFYHYPNNIVVELELPEMDIATMIILYGRGVRYENNP